MSSSSIRIIRCLLGLLVTVQPWAARSQSVPAQGTESRVHAPLLGDQVWPALSVNAEGGYVVWQDNAIDGADLGIAGCRIDSNLSPLPGMFRVNSIAAGDQTHPAVAILPDGGAVFTFQGAAVSSPSSGSSTSGSTSTPTSSSSSGTSTSSSGSSLFGTSSSSSWKSIGTPKLELDRSQTFKLDGALKTATADLAADKSSGSSLFGSSFSDRYGSSSTSSTPDTTTPTSGTTTTSTTGSSSTAATLTGGSDAFIRFMSVHGQFPNPEVSLTPGLRTLRQDYQITRLSWVDNRLVQKSWVVPSVVTLAREQTTDARPAVLPDGRVAVVYSGLLRYQTNTQEIVTTVTSSRLWGSTRYTTNDTLQPVQVKGSSGQDIFLQQFGTNQERIGSEVVVNQFTANNQRQPAIEVLPNGQFVIAWASEDHVAILPGDSSRVVIRARLFHSDGQPAGDEFLVSGSDSICARPAVAGFQGGGFTVVWNQRALVASNSWDVHARTFSSQGLATSDPFRVNKHTYRDQLAPSVSKLGGQQMVVWTSVGQDGSREGVFGRVLTPAGSSTEEFQVNATSVSQQIHPTTVSDGHDRSVVLWSSFVGEEGFEVLKRVYYSAPALPAPEPPAVAAIDVSSLEVSWSPAPAADLNNYELYMDSLGVPVMVWDTTYLATGLEPDSTHTFQLVYVLTDGRRSLPSGLATGTTLADPSTQTGSTGNPDDTSGQTGSGPGTTPGGDPNLVVRVGIRYVQRLVEVSWNTQPGHRYQIQISVDMNEWIDFGSVRVAAGTSDAVTVNPKEPVAWFRVVQVP